MNPDPAALAALLRQLEATQWQSAEALAALQRDRLDKLTAHLDLHCAQFRMRLRKAGLNRTDLLAPHGLQQLPVLSRRSLQNAEGLYCETLPESHLPTYETHTSGSTGEPVVVRRTAVSALDWMAITVRDHLWQKRDFRGRFCSIRANISNPFLQQNWGPPVSWLVNSGPLLGIPIATDVGRQIELIREFQPHFLLIYPSILAALQRLAPTLPGVRQILTVGETLSAQTRDEAFRQFHLTITDTYSSQELGTIALQCPDSALYHVMAENLIVEVLDEDDKPCGDGETGRVVITDLRNFATPLIRYDIGDYAKPGPPCSCGRGLPTLLGIVGRKRNLVLMPDGTRHWPLVGFKIFRKVASVRQYQFVQDGRDTIEMRLVTERPLSAREEGDLESLVQDSIGFPFKLRFSYFVDKIPRSPSGKFDEFICLV